MLFTEYDRKNILTKLKRALAAILAGCLLVSALAGCGRRELEADDAGGVPVEQTTQEVQAGGETPALGRYVESEFTYGEDCSLEQAGQILPWDGGLYLTDSMGAGVMADLEQRTLADADTLCPEALKQRFAADDYLANMVTAENGARMYTIFSSTDQEGSYQYEMFYLSPDGKETPWEYVPKERGANLFYGRDGYFYVTDSRRSETTKVYRVNSEDGETEFLFEVDGSAGYLARCGNFILLDMAEQLKIYDLETRTEREEDKVLSDLLAGSLGHANGTYSYAYLLYPGEEDSVYVATKKGLYRHVLYGSVAEQLIDGSLCSLSDSTWFVDLYAAEETEEMPVFYLLYEDYRLLRYEYDAQMPSVPEKLLSIYSLYEDQNIQDVISAYRAQYPEVYVRYEVGVSGENGVTREDALKNLATALAAGEGPDLFLLDDLPYASYVEKGVLMDLSALYAELQEEYTYFDNIIQALRRDDALYTLPLGFSMPVLMGDGEKLADIHSVEDMLRAFREAKAAKGGAKVGLVSEEVVLQTLLFAYGGTLTKEDGSLDRAAVTELLQLGGEIYEIDRADLAQEEIEERQRVWRTWEDLESTLRSSQMFYLSKNASSALQAAGMYGDCFAIGGLGGAAKHEFNTFHATLEAGKMDYMPLPGPGTAALPMTLFGINAASNASQEAQAFVRYALGDWMSESTMYWATPINRDALVKLEENPYKDEQGNPSYEPYVWMSSSMRNEDGTEGERISVEVKWCRPEEYEDYHRMLDSIDTVILYDYMLRDTVIEEGAKALAGEQSVEEAVNAIERKLQLYLAE